MLLTPHGAGSHSLRWKAHLIRFGLEIVFKGFTAYGKKPQYVSALKNLQ